MEMLRITRIQKDYRVMPEQLRWHFSFDKWNWRLPPGYSIPMHMHPYINAGVLLKGELTVITEGGDVVHLKPDDPIVGVKEAWRHGKNEGDETAEIIVFYAGVMGKPISIKKTGN